MYCFSAVNQTRPHRFFLKPNHFVYLYTVPVLPAPAADRTHLLTPPWGSSNGAAPGDQW